MSFFNSAVVRVATAAAATAAVAAPVAAQAGTSPAAQAGTSPVSDSITIKPAKTVAVGDSVTITASATNTTSSTISGSLGLKVPDPSLLHDTRVTGGARNVGGKLIYKGDTQWAPGQTITLSLTATTLAAGTEKLSVYSDGTGSTSSVYAYGTLTISS
ncbi:MAG: hypothetical protein J2P25_12180 [Nocardiopsaceae bacterium]|nr:hypothetical protein [Nocardiopsaceae bacterium]